MKKVILEGVSERGKENISIHGEHWLVIMRRKFATFKDIIEYEKILVQSIKNGNHLRWIKANNDPNFEILKAEDQ